MREREMMTMRGVDFIIILGGQTWAIVPKMKYFHIICGMSSDFRCSRILLMNFSIENMYFRKRLHCRKNFTNELLLICISGRDFIAPCKCKGSAKYVHRECLDHWRSVKVKILWSKWTSTFVYPLYLWVYVSASRKVLHSLTVLHAKPFTI